MIVYRDYRYRVCVNDITESVGLLINQIQDNPQDRYENAVSLLIECGELETGISDYFCKNVDTLFFQNQICRNITICAGEILSNLWNYKKLLPYSLQTIKTGLFDLKKLTVPEFFHIGVPEGFVFYSLYPEIYFEATKLFISEKSPDSVVVIGLRSIGAQLSALVAAGLRMAGSTVYSYTIRPRGHPFNRVVTLSKELEYKLKEYKDCYFVLVDEGPGLSGSSFGGAISKLREIGIADNRICIFPSWIPDSRSFISKSARELWGRYPKYCGSFEHQWIESGRLEQNLGKKIEKDISAGWWRTLMYTDEADYPAIHPQHERRKYLLVNDNELGTARSIAKFAGLGKYGLRCLSRANVFANFGFSPVIEKYSDGFLVMECIDGRPLQRIDYGPDLVLFVKKYLSCLNDNFKSAPLMVDFDKMYEMIFLNIEEALGRDWSSRVEKLNSLKYKELYLDETVAIDGSMMPQDFIRTKKGFYKLDNIEHHADQFFHGCQNIAWDVAGFCVEFGLDMSRSKRFIDEINLKNSGVREGFPFFIIAYLSYRLGYVSLASDSLPGQRDGERFLELKKRYSHILMQQLLSL